MQIRTYDEVDPFQVHELTVASFGWTSPEARIRRQIRKDPRVMDGYAYFAVERGRVVAQVQPLRIPVRLMTGIETIGGIAAVCSYPDVWGRGHVRSLMEHVHGVFREEGMRIAALTTSRNIRGHGVYRGLGYVDLVPYYVASKRIRRRPTHHPGIRFRIPRRREIPRIQEIFRTFARGLCGWTERTPDFLGGGEIWIDDYLDRFRLVYRDGTLVGYLRQVPGEDDFVEELVLPNASDMRAVLRTLEAKSTTGAMNVGWLTSDADLNRVRALGYSILGPTPQAAMALSLRRNLPTRSLPRLFGVPQGRFVLYPTDHF